MTPEDIDTLKQIDPVGASETNREHMRHGMQARQPSMAGVAFSVYALPWAFKFTIKLIGGLFL